MHLSTERLGTRGENIGKNPEHWGAGVTAALRL